MNRPLTLVYITALIVGISYGMHNPIVPVFSKDVIGASYFDLGVIGFSNFIPYMFIPLFVGILLDRFNNGLLLSVGIVLNTSSIYLLSISHTVPEVAIYRALTGIAHSFFWPPCESIISQTSTPQTRVKSISKFMGFFVGGMMIGPLIGTFLLQDIQVTYRVLFQYATFAIAIAIVSSLLLTKYGRTNQHVKLSLAAVRQIFKFPTVIMILLFCSTAFGTFLAIFPAYLSDRSISQSDIELLFFIFGVSRLVSLFFADHLVKKLFAGIIGVIISIAVGMIIVFYSHTMILFSLAVFIMGFGFSVYFPLTFEIIMRKEKKENAGSLIGAYESTFGIGWAAGPFFAGIAANFFGSEMPYLIFFVIGIVITAIVISKKKMLQPQWNPNL